MFTGLIEDIGELVGLRSRGGVREMTIRTALPADDLRAGASIATCSS